MMSHRCTELLAAGSAPASYYYTDNTKSKEGEAHRKQQERETREMKVKKYHDTNRYIHTIHS